MKTNIYKFTFALLTIAASMALIGCSTTDNGSFPQPTANFTPRQTYAVASDTLWQTIADALEKNRITTVSMDKASGVIQTDYIAGPGRLIAGGFAGTQNTRYKYSITVRNTSDGKVKLNIICKIESSINGSNGSSQWRDVTPQNGKLCTSLETWLYEQVEKNLP
jgi:hypothetical protein